MQGNEAFLNDVIDSIQDGISVLDRDLNIVRVNRVMSERYARMRPLEGKKCYHVYKRSSVPCERCPSRRAIEQKTAQSEVVPFQDAGGDPDRWHEIYAYPLTDGRGEVTGVVQHVRDVTERKRAEGSLQLMQYMIDQTQDEASLAGPDGRFVYVNDAKCRSLGYTREELLSLAIWDVDAEMAPEMWPAIWKDLKEKGFKKVEALHRAKDGRTFPTEIWTDYLNFHGKEYVCAFVRDIAERKRAQEALAESEKKFRVLAETTKAGIVLYRDRKLIYVNPTLERITGYTKEELTTMDFWDTVHPDYRELVRSRGFARQRGKRVPSTYEFQILGRSGEAKWVELSATMISYEGRPTVLATVFDITDRKRSEAELQEAKAEAELYLDLMGHDIKNLNQISLGFLELASDSLARDSEAKDLIARPLEALSASTRLIENVRKLRKIKEGGLKFHEIDVGGTIARIVPRYENAAGRGIRINYSADCECRVMANDLLDDIFSNVIGNAIKHSRGPLTIDVRLNRVMMGDRDYCLVAVEDDGPGIPDALKGELFTRFQGRKQRPNGRGLGLYIVGKLVEDFHGRAWVEDRVRGDHTLGARFMILLPAA